MLDKQFETFDQMDAAGLTLTMLGVVPTVLMELAAALMAGAITVRKIALR
jgi:hypothetical protein